MASHAALNEHTFRDSNEIRQTTSYTVYHQLENLLFHESM